MANLCWNVICVLLIIKYFCNIIRKFWIVSWMIVINGSKLLHHLSMSVSRRISDQITRNEILVGPNRGSSTQLFDDTVVMITSCLINCGNATDRLDRPDWVDDEREGTEKIKETEQCGPSIFYIVRIISS